MNRIKMEFDAISENEGLARVCVAAFAARLDPTLEEINDIKTAVSEAVTNSVIHGYDEKGGRIIMEAAIEGRELEVIITDYGKGIENVEPQAPKKSARGWALPSWRCLWMSWRCGPSRTRAPLLK